MICAHCNGQVTWRGPLSALTHTECESCGRQNCQRVDPDWHDYDDEDEAFGVEVNQAMLADKLADGYTQRAQATAMRLQIQAGVI